MASRHVQALCSAACLVLCLVLAVGIATAASDSTYTPYKDAISGRVLGLIRQDFRPAAGKAGTPVTSAAVVDQARDFVATHAEELGLEPSTVELVALATEVDKLGLGHQRFGLRHGGLPVFGGEVYVHIDGGAGVYYVTTKPMGEAPATLVPVLTAEDARQAALDWAATKAPVGAPIEADVPELVILPLRVSGQRDSNESRLAWWVRVATADQINFDEQCFVDARDGAIVFHISNIATLVRQIADCNVFPSSCYMDVQRTQYMPYWFGRSETPPVRGPHPIPGVFYGSNDVDMSHAYAIEPHNYYLNKFNRNGGNDQGGIGTGLYEVPISATRALTHLDLMWAACPASAAFGFTKGQLQFCVNSVTAMDIFGHEYAHSIPLFSFRDQNGRPIGAVYAGETGALQEAYSDLVGDAIELQFSGQHNWILGASFLANGTPVESNLGPIRDLADPASLIEPEFGLPYPDRFYSPNVYCGTVDGGGLHHNSTVPGYSMYLTAEGGTANGCTITAIGQDAVERIWYRAWTVYFTRTATFNEAYFGLLQAAADLYPQEIVDQVRIALQAVEMDQPGLCSGLPAQTPACAFVSAVPEDSVSPADGSSIRFCGPNPAFGPATIKYALARPGRVDVTVYDAAGRLVDTVASESQDRGIHQATWTGRRAASGIYFVRVAVDGQTVGTEKLLVIR